MAKEKAVAEEEAAAPEQGTEEVVADHDAEVAETIFDRRTGTYDGLSFVRLPDNSFLFIGNDDKIIEKVLSLGLQTFYVLGEAQVSRTEPNGIKKLTKIPRMYRVIYSIMGLATIEVSCDEVPLPKLEHKGAYSMPPIPMVMLKRVEALLRAIYAEHKTEGVVVLTFDTSKDDSTGWGFVVPKQSNTPAHCHYEPDTVMDQLGPNDAIVGSIHSHPMMSAHASGTDHNDQAEFDGLHITFGWRSDDRVEYHIEWQAGPCNFSVDPDVAFERAPLPELDEELQHWMEEQVSKATTTTTTYSANRGGAGGGGTNAGTGNRGVSYQKHMHRDRKNLPNDVPNGQRDLVMVQAVREELEGDDYKWHCAACGINLTDSKVKRLRCYACGAYLFADAAGVDDLGKFFSIRNDMDSLTAEFDHADLNVFYFDHTDQSLTALVIEGKPTEHARAAGYEEGSPAKKG